MLSSGEWLVLISLLMASSSFCLQTSLSIAISIYWITDILSTVEPRHTDPGYFVLLAMSNTGIITWKLLRKSILKSCTVSNSDFSCRWIYQMARRTPTRRDPPDCIPRSLFSQGDGSRTFLAGSLFRCAALGLCGLDSVSTVKPHDDMNIAFAWGWPSLCCTHFPHHVTLIQ